MKNFTIGYKYKHKSPLHVRWRTNDVLEPRFDSAVNLMMLSDASTGDRSGAVQLTQ